MRALIVGNSATAVGAIESMREYDDSVEILVISSEDRLVYSRPLLSHYLAGEIDESRVAYRDAHFYARHNVDAIVNSTVVAIDLEEHRVRVHSGDTYEYDKLLISTGGIPIVPPVPGLDAQGVFTFTRIDDTRGIIEYLESRCVRHAVVVGGGMIGIKATDGLLKRGVQVTMVELAPRILSAGLDETASAMMSNLLREAGVEVITENSVDAIRSEAEPGTTRDRIRAVELRDGRSVECQLLIFGIGVRPNASLAKDAGITVNRGVVVDKYMRTSVPDVYAAGDVAEAYDLVVDMNRTVAIWPNAYRQGAIAGAHMVGIEHADEGGIAMNALEVCDVPAMSIGDANAPEEGDDILVELDERNNRYKRLVLRNDRLVGAILVGNVNRAGIYTGLIRRKIPIGDSRNKLMSEHFGILSLPDQYRKHLVTGAGIEV